MQGKEDVGGTSKVGQRLRKGRLKMTARLGVSEEKQTLSLQQLPT